MYIKVFFHLGAHTKYRFCSYVYACIESGSSKLVCMPSSDVVWTMCEHVTNIRLKSYFRWCSFYLTTYVSASEILGPIDEMTSLSKMTYKTHQIIGNLRGLLLADKNC